jgi:hypothetical protein
VENESTTSIDEMEAPAEQREPPRAAASSLALTLTLVSLVLWLGFQAFQMVRERGNLSLVRASQDSAVQEAEKIRTQFEALISKLSDLANKGHAGAKMVMDELQNRGVGAAAEPAVPQPQPAK